MIIKIEGGTVVTSEKEFVANVWVENDKIIVVGNSALHPDVVIDAHGRYVLPGAIDPHVHMELPTPAGPSSDDFYSGSIAALYGGTSTLIDFVTPSKGQSLVEALEVRKAEASKSLADYSFHVSPIEWRSSMEEEIAECIKRGITSFKIYMAYKGVVGLSDEDVYKVLEVVGRHGGIVTVHAELGDEIDALRDKAAEDGKLNSLAHMQTRPPETEYNAVKRVVDMAKETHCPLYVVHVSTKESIEYIAQARANGQKVFAETCPHYLLLDKELYSGTFENTVKYVLSPPLREKADRDALWNAIANETVSTVGTDHCPFTLSQKSAGQKDFRKVPNGAGGVEYRIGLLYTYGVLTHKITMSKLVDLACTQPARIFGLSPQKGEIAVGADADIVIWNPTTKTVIDAKKDHQNCDLNIFEGFVKRGSAQWLIKGGLVLIKDGILHKDVAKGKFLMR